MPLNQNLVSQFDPSTLRLTAKNKPLDYKIEDKNSFYRISSKIPAEYTGKFVRINAFVTAKLECRGKDGWLIKVMDKKIKSESKIDPNIDTISADEDDCNE